MDNQFIFVEAYLKSCLAILCHGLDSFILQSTCLVFNSLGKGFLNQDFAMKIVLLMLLLCQQVSQGVHFFLGCKKLGLQLMHLL